MTQRTQPTPVEGRQDYPVDFVHVGLSKCASTFLQQVWIEDAAYNILNPAQMVQAVRIVAEGKSGQAISFTPPPKVANKFSVLSSEGFTWGWINQPESQTAIKPLQGLVARVLSQRQFSGQVLIMVRDPVTLLRAMHEQSIKEGGFASYAEFLSSQRRLCEAILDLRFIIETFQKHWENIVVLSADELRNNPQVFWAKYAANLSVPEPTQEALDVVDKSGAHQNKSLGKRMEILAQLNRLAAATTDCFEGLTEYKAAFNPEFQQAKPVVYYYREWLYRRIVEFASDEQLRSITEMLAPYDDVVYGEVFVDQALHDWIETKFLQPLESIPTIPQELISRYRQSLADALRTA